ncbi:MAG TPA: alpha-ketoglutarate-dependent dioxygenase AlkB, partial [Rhodocyclaceae bacterium]|nr:alpha-ketoglutarate-dependent dioxygenase AlkB [Rhodocyclaceae bacterium]
MTTPDLFEGWTPEDVGPEALSPGAVLLRGFVRAEAAAVLAELDRVLAHAPLRTMQTPGGRSMSVATSNCGARGWVSDAAGYRYAPADPLGGAAWPAMPQLWRTLAERAAAAAGFGG